jgi:hypothetical protein
LPIQSYGSGLCCKGTIGLPWNFVVCGVGRVVAAKFSFSKEWHLALLFRTLSCSAGPGRVAPVLRLPDLSDAMVAFLQRELLFLPALALL